MITTSPARGAVRTALVRFAASAALCAAALVPAAAAAQAYPTKPVRMVVPFPAGGGSDISARRLGDRLSTLWKQPVVIHNIGGGAGNVAASVVAASEPDGYTVFFVSLGILVTNPLLYSKLPFDPDHDFAHVALLAETPHIMLISPGVPATNLREFVNHVKANPGKLNFGSGGQGTSLHLAAELFRSVAGLQMTHIPYKGAAPTLAALMSDEIQMFMDNGASAIGQMRNGRLRGLAVAAKRRLALAPDLPTFEESGYPNFVTGVPHGIVVRRGTPAAVIAEINRAVNAVIDDPEYRKQSAAAGSLLMGGKPDQLTAYLAQEKKRWEPLIRSQGIKAF